MIRCQACVALSVMFLAGCAAQFPVPADDFADSAAAIAVLEKSIAAHGGYLYDRPETVRVAYDGRWRNAVRVLQPVLVDAGFRQQSDEYLDLARDKLVQTHTGPDGTKRVTRTPDSILVEYNGEESQDSDTRDAAALVADAYTMFLTGPSFFKRREAQLALLPPDSLDGRPHQRIHARLRPGFGFSEEDEAVLWVDEQTGRLNLVHFTIEGLASTRGAHVDVAFRDHRDIGGYIWPLNFYERVRAPLRVAAHSWHVTALEISGTEGGRHVAKTDER